MSVFTLALTTTALRVGTTLAPFVLGFLHDRIGA
jgi:hypothetical protein